MAHDVFISHAYRDKPIAVAICKRLESAQVGCWIAERDVSAGGDWTEATRNAIASSRVMVLLLSENANAAPHIERGIAHAFYTKRAILPVRLTETPPKRAFLFYLGNARWFDAFPSPPEQHLEELAASINGIVQGQTITRDVKLPHLVPNEARKTLEYSDSWMGALRASHYGALNILKRIAIVAALLAAIAVLGFVYLQMKDGAFQQESGVPTVNSVPNASPKGTADSSASSNPAYTYTRLGLWVSSNASPSPSQPERSSEAQPTAAPTSSAETKPSPNPKIEPNISQGKKGPTVGENVNVNSVPQNSPGIPDRTTPLAVEPSPTPGGSSSEEQSLKELVLTYLRTVAANDNSTQERLFAGRVDFYGEGVLSFPEIGASMERYRREWPIRKWEPKGEPQFPNSLHSSNPDLYEVLQPFDWTVANGSKHKQGSATLYLKIRKAENGAFHIFHLEQRHP